MTSRPIDTNFLRRCIRTLERAYTKLNELPTKDHPDYELYRAACVKEFELVLEQGGKLLRKRISAYFASAKDAARLTYKDLFRYASRHDLMDITTVERWIHYRDNRNDTVHDYGEGFAESTLVLLPKFIEDANALAELIEQKNDD
ncbi:MAG: nucleotidyltransferase [Gammaproteobacteria bacterium]|nr:nucleotidyltransferase [Gammaproteobacteria bacterium]MYF03172.1 nucleotidyltransferase [Gammaproteobacteria bacterium]MYI77498.1 nucleotidyltransferase [Gammaproteobacteria bacterium]